MLCQQKEKNAEVETRRPGFGSVSSKLGGLGQVAISASFRLLAGEMEPGTGWALRPIIALTFSDFIWSQVKFQEARRQKGF